MYVNTAWQALEIQKLVCLFKCNYFEGHNIEFLKTCTFYRLWPYLSTHVFGTLLNAWISNSSIILNCMIIINKNLYSYHFCLFKEVDHFVWMCRVVYGKFANLKDHLFYSVLLLCFVIKRKIDLKELNTISASCTWQIDN